MKLSVSLPDEDVEFLDAYAESQGVRSRSAAVHRAVRLLRASELGVQYDAAFREWDESGEGVVWEDVVGDGLSDG
ncbi:MAG TPA: ribbon-helix-helix domain-containing protein [Mycobacteriales bacterium]|jgi:Arc/MetJ-type ribon-helix-helix transcriptional regulator|nr:ribbon-helix-helix domain-containing protein [Mycobacteriales bacterium]HVX69049.1 ribbon-helix-helix domain-containing protein [Mycobacteriales bacterium]